jgi:hypothetical protein
MANRIHKPLKIIAFNANGIMKQRYELINSSKTYT